MYTVHLREGETCRLRHHEADELGQRPDGAYPHLAEMMRTYARQPESAPQRLPARLDLLLHGLELLRRV